MNAATASAAVPTLETLKHEESAAKQLFFGDIFEENLFPYPKMRERDREMLGSMVDAIDAFLVDRQKELKEWDRSAHQPDEFVQALREMGLFGLIIPEEFGGLELSNAAYARVREKFLKLRYEEDPTVIIDEVVNLGNEVARAKLKRRVFPPNGDSARPSRPPFLEPSSATPVP